MNGIRTLADLLDRCRVDEETGCWLWAGAMSKGVPRIWSSLLGKTVTGGRLAWQLAHGEEPPTGMTVYRDQLCAARCVNPEHLKEGTKAESGAALRASGKLRGDPRRAAQCLRNGMRQSKGSPQLRALILASDEPATHLAPKLGLSHTTISLVRQGKRWAGLAGSSVFSWPGGGGK